MARDRATFFTPVVMFFDELEAMFSRRGSGISSDVQKTIVPQLLAEIDGIEDTRNVIVVGASNRFDLIDPAVLRPGRLDFKIKIPRPDQHQARSILAKYLTADVPFSADAWQMAADMQHTNKSATPTFAALEDFLAEEINQLANSTRDLEIALFLTDLYKGRQPPVRNLTLKAEAVPAADEDKSRINCWSSRTCLTLTQESFQGLQKDIIPGNVLESLKHLKNKAFTQVQLMLAIEEQLGKAQTHQYHALFLQHAKTSEGIAWRAIRQGEQISEKEDPASKKAQRGVSAWLVNDPENAQIGWGVLVVGYPGSKCPEVVRSYVEPLIQTIAETIHRRREVANRLIERVIDIIFHEKSYLIIMELKKAHEAQYAKINKPRTLEKRIQEIVNGAMLASIVSRAKRLAVKREIAKRNFGREGINWLDLYGAIKTECEEGKDQYVYELYGDDIFGRGQSYQDTERFAVDVILPPSDELAVSDPWLTSKVYAWRTSGTADP
jgi:hypothetical protein